MKGLNTCESLEVRVLFEQVVREIAHKEGHRKGFHGRGDLCRAPEGW